MPSPFPGMNPYFEKPYLWPDFHNSYLFCAKAALAAKIRGRYLIHYDKTVYLREVPDELRPFAKPDLSIAYEGAGRKRTRAAATLVADEFEIVDPFEDTFEQGYLEILDIESRDVVTVIELLSPANKATGPDRDHYLRKRHRLLHSPANFVEIDLLRGGPRLPLSVPPPADFDYYTLISRAERRPTVEFVRIGLRDRLPAIPIPLKAGDADATLDLQAVLDRAYDEGTFPEEIYVRPPEPRLRPADRKWAAQFVPRRS